MSIEAFELEYNKSRWLAPLGVFDALYDALLRLPAKGQKDYITLGCRDSDVEICSATKHSRFVKEPFAHTEEQAKSKLREKPGSMSCDKCTNADLPAANDAVSESGAEKIAPGSPVPLFAAIGADAVRCLRENRLCCCSSICLPKETWEHHASTALRPPPVLFAAVAERRCRGRDAGHLDQQAKAWRLSERCAGNELPIHADQEIRQRRGTSNSRWEQ